MNAALHTVVKRLTPHCDLPPLPKIAARALALAADPNAKVASVAHIVEADPILTVRVLKIAGSVMYVRREPPRTLESAIMSLGFHALSRVLIAASAAAAYRVEATAAEAMWTHALLTGLAADEFGALHGRVRGGSDFLAGLLHDIGRLVMHVADPAIILYEADGALTFEQEYFGATHAEVGGYVAQQWGLDHQIVEAVLMHHRPMSELAKRVAAAESVAEYAAGCLDDSSRDSEARAIPLVSAVCARFHDESALFE